MKVQEVMQRQVTTVAEDESVGLALQLMLWSRVRHVPVLRRSDGQVSGMISERDVLRAHQLHGEAALAREVRTIMVSPPEQVRPDADLTDVAAELATKHIGCLPVVVDGQLVGIVTTSEALGTIRRDQVEASIPGKRTDEVAAIMHPGPLLGHPEDGLLRAAGRMLQANVRHLCVVDSEQRLVGILSDRDLRRTLGDPRQALNWAQRRVPLVKATIGHAMTPAPLVLAQDQPISAAVDALLSHRVGALPVVDRDRRVVGIVSYLDVLRRFAEQSNQERITT